MWRTAHKRISKSEHTNIVTSFYRRRPQANRLSLPVKHNATFNYTWQTSIKHTTIFNYTWWTYIIHGESQSNTIFNCNTIAHPFPSNNLHNLLMRLAFHFAGFNKECWKIKFTINHILYYIYPWRHLFKMPLPIFSSLLCCLKWKDWWKYCPWRCFLVVSTIHFSCIIIIIVTTIIMEAYNAP